jgi:hypothetical protein
LLPENSDNEVPEPDETVREADESKKKFRKKMSNVLDALGLVEIPSTRARRLRLSGSRVVVIVQYRELASHEGGSVIAGSAFLVLVGFVA